MEREATALITVHILPPAVALMGAAGEELGPAQWGGGRGCGPTPLCLIGSCSLPMIWLHPEESNKAASRVMGRALGRKQHTWKSLEAPPLAPVVGISPEHVTQSASQQEDRRQLVLNFLRLGPSLS